MPTLKRSLVGGAFQILIVQAILSEAGADLNDYCFFFFYLASPIVFVHISM